MIATESADGRFTITADGQLTIRETGTVKNYLVEALERYREIVVDLSQIEAIDLPCLQLLYCAKRLARASRRQQLFRVILPESLRRGLMAEPD